MTESAGPVVLLADSQLLFAKESNDWFRQRLSAHVSSTPSFAVYIGAANQNEQAFYEMGCDGLKEFGIDQTLFLKAHLNDLGELQHQTPSVILLAGGDVALGWEFLKQKEIANWVLGCHQKGSLLLGISAGAIHLTNGLSADTGSHQIPFYNLFAAVTLVHEENENWPSERLYCCINQESIGCLKIPFGGGCWIQRGDPVFFGKHQSVLMNGDRVVSVPFELGLNT